jgi:predicted dehydrogenase
MRELKAALIGCGNIARRHVQHLNQEQVVPGMWIAAFVDVDIARAEALCTQAQGEFATNDLTQVLKRPDIEWVLIATPFPTHVPLCKVAAEHGKHIFVEKPLGQSLTECLDLARILKKRDLVFLTGYCYRFHPAYTSVKEEIPVPSMSWTHVMGKKETPGIEYLYHNLSHALDLICWLHGTEPSQVFAQAASATGTTRPLSACDRWIISLRFANGSIASIGVGGDAETTFLPKWYFKICGPNGHTAEVVNHQHVHVRPKAHKDQREMNYFAGHVEEMKDFAEAIRQGKSLRVSLKEAVRANYLLELVQQSADANTPVQYDQTLLAEV